MMYEDDWEGQETITDVRIGTVAKQYGVSSSALKRRVLAICPSLRHNECVEGARYMVNGRQVPGYTYMGIPAWAVGEVERQAHALRWAAQRRAGKVVVSRTAQVGGEVVGNGLHS